MKCPKCGAIMEACNPGYDEHWKKIKEEDRKPYWRCADWKCFHKVQWNKKRDGEFAWDNTFENKRH